jgi:RNA polymerase sigma-70 factor (ECF subfamily)
MTSTLPHPDEAPATASSSTEASTFWANGLPYLNRLAYWLLENHAEADDVTMDAVLSLHVKSFDPSNPGAMRYARTTLTNKARDRLRGKRRRARPLPDDLVSREPACDARLLEAEEQQERKLLRERLPEALAQLNPREREAIRLHLVEGLTYRQAGKVLGVPPGTVISRCARGLCRLRKLLDVGEEGPTP